MSKIAFIAPDKQLFLKGKKIIHELGIDEKAAIYLARLKRAVRLAKKLETEDVDVIVSRGGTASLMIQSGINIPVVEIAITGQDLAQVFYECKKMTGFTKPRVSILAFHNMVEDIGILSSIFDVSLSILPLEKMEDISLRIEELSRTDVDIVVGGIKTAILAKQKGFTVIRIASGEFSIRTAFLEAQRILRARQIEKERNQEFKALIDYSIEGIVSINDKKVIKVFNAAAEKLLNLPAKDMVGKRLDTVLSFIHTEECLMEGKESIGHTAKLPSKWLMYNMALIIVDKKVIGALITFQDITKIQEMEIKIRNEVSRKKLEAKYQFHDIAGISNEITEAKRMARQIALVDSTVLITGESGTGKELLAQSIHNGSQRKNGPFVAVNCAALPSNLLESELFGYVEGAFTGAARKGKPGLFEMAHRGTIFLDEISEMDQYGQSRLLRVLQEKEVMRLGDDKYTPVDIRIIAATNKNLYELMKAGKFRQDLYYRLKVLTINIPPLQKRNGDVPFLAQNFLKQMNKQYSKDIVLTSGALKKLESCHWPGNVRELMYFIERIVVITENQEISEKDIIDYFDKTEPQEEENHTAVNAAVNTEEQRILAALEECHSNITRTAKLLGMDRSTLYRKLRTYKIEVKKTF